MHYPATTHWARPLISFLALVLLLLAPFAASQAQVGNAANGKTTYNAILATGKNSCGNATCHTIDPTRNQNKIRPAGYTEASIKTAISRGIGGVSEMTFLSPVLTTQNIADLAAYIFNPAAATGGGTPTAALSPASVVFGSSTVGVAAATQTVTVSNTGTAALVLSAITTGSTEFAVSGGSCTASSSIAAAGSCTVILSFTPSAAGARSAALTVNHNATPASSTVGLSGIGVAIVVAAPNAQLSTPSLTFGSAAVGAAASPVQAVTITNTGTAPLVLSGISTANTEFAVSGGTCTASSSIAPAGTCTISLTFTPNAAGARSATLTVSHNATPASSAVALSGTGTAVVITAPVAQLTPTTLSFGSSTLGVATATQTVTVGNTGNAALLMSGVATASTEFAVSGGTCTATSSIAPGASCTIVVGFTPSAAGARSAALTVSHNATGGSATAGLSGTGVAVVVTTPSVAVAPAALSFGTSTIGTATGSQNVTVTSTGTAALNLSAISTASTEFVVSGGTCTASSTLLPSSSCAISVTFTPSAAGARSATLTVSHNASGGSSTVGLSGTGTALVITAPIAQLTPTTLSFGSSNLGAATATQTVTVGNTGNAALLLSGVATASTEFAVSGGTCTATSSIAPGANCTVLVSFTPSAAGARSATLTVSHNATPASSTVALSGTGVAVVVTTPGASVAPAALSFGTATIGVATGSQNVTLSSTGTAPLNLSAISTGSTEFAVTGGTCTASSSLAPSATCAISITFTPSAAGARSATLTVNHNATPASATVALSGTGTAVVITAPIAQLTPTTLSFASSTVGVATATQTVTVGNTGNAALILSGIATASTEFAVSGGTCTASSSIAPGANCTVVVGFTPSAAGARSATLTVSHNATGGSSTVSLSGAGTAIVGAAQVLLNKTALNFAGTSVGTTSSGQTVIVSNTGGSPLTMGAVVSTNPEFTVTLSTCGAGAVIAPGANCLVSVSFAPSAVGTRNAVLTINHNATPPSNAVALSGTGTTAIPVTGVTKVMTEYRYVPLAYYFITSRDTDKAILDVTAGFERTGQSFPVYVTQQPNTAGISRYYFDQVALAGKRGSHFYTLVDAEKLLLLPLNPTNAQLPKLPFDEGTDSFAHPPLVEGVGGSCAAAQSPVYRLFRGNVLFPDDPNHRFTTSIAIYNEFVALGWDGEGVKFCVPQ